MLCETTRQHLLAHADEPVLPPEVNAHVVGCAACTKLARQLHTMNESLRAITVPASDDAKARFLETISTADLPPIIERSAVRTRDSSTSLRPWRGWSWKTEWQYAGGIAAVVLLAVGGWWFSSSPRAKPEMAKLRHELLKHEVASVTRMTRAQTPEDRLAAWTELTGHLHTETKHVYKIASPTDLETLERMFGKVVNEGVLTQAKLLPATYSPAQREKALADIDAKLQAAQTDAETLSPDAPTTAQPALLKIAGTAREARAKLQAIIRGEA
jgi:hypothetical protein